MVQFAPYYGSVFAFDVLFRKLQPWFPIQQTWDTRYLSYVHFPNMPCELLLTFWTVSAWHELYPFPEAFRRQTHVEILGIHLLAGAC